MESPFLFLPVPVGGNIVTAILVVDDSNIMRQMIVACLRSLEGAEFAQAASGLEAIERLSLAPYDLLVLDLNMPDIGGFEVIEFVRAQDRLKDLPILVVTTRGDDGSRARALGSGASAFLTKPFTPEEIRQQAEQLVTRSV
jgi:two-component system chemotaxis response regulator CheY